jgi:hypothetical protein
MKRLSRTLMAGFFFLAGWVATPPDLRAQPRPAKEAAPTPEQVAFFEKSIRPVLARECYSCHSATAEKLRGGLKLDTREALRKGGKSGAVVVSGDPKGSLLLKAIRHEDAELKMPPKKKLGDDVIADFEKWVALGAPDPRDGGASGATKYEIDVEKGRKFWAFQPPKKSAAPPVKDDTWPACDIDRFLLAGLEARGLRPVADADPRTLIRRLSFDLTGLPPAPDDVEAFVKDYAAKPKAALEAVVDRLLASPQFGERWGRHWLDVARYAESSGRAANFAFPHAWRYRDYVIGAFNKDTPYDQFVREQLAGDLLPAKDDRQKAEFLVATGFLAVGPKSLDERNPRQFEMDVADEQIDATFQAFQGLTAACARCHDHKFDPIPQKDYYALAGIFRSTQTCYGTIRLINSNHPSSLITLPKEAGAVLPLEPLSAERRSGIEKQIKDVRDQMAQLTGQGQDVFIRRIFMQNRVTTLQSQLVLYESDGTPKPLAMGVREAIRPADSPVLARGEIQQPGATVRRGFPQVLTTKQPYIRRDESGRLKLADWIASTDNPLTARVMANRVWLHLFGRGLVPTPDNFGASGLPPSHPALLDYLAVSLAEDGWSVKRLIRGVVLSRAYRLSSQFDEKNFDADPDNVLVWRVPKRRLEAEALRDAMLALSGRLDLTPPKGDSVARGGEGNAAFRGRGPGGDPALGDTHRTVYLPVVRDGLPESLTLFDFPDPSLIVGERATTTVPAQSLYLMNNPFVIRQAEGMAERLLAGDGDADAWLTRAYRLCYARPPSDQELKGAKKFVADYGKDHGRHATYAALCQALFASAEFSHR